MDFNQRLTLNASVEQLIESGGTDAEARAAIAEFGRKLEAASRVQLEASFTKPGGNITGQTEEHGQVQVSDDAPVTKEVSHGSPKERIGYYKIWREKVRKKDWIVISHFWKADQASGSDAEVPQQWVLSLGRNGEPDWFAERGIRDLYTLNFTKYLALGISREVYPQTWGISAPQERKGGFIVKLLVTNK